MITWDVGLLRFWFGYCRTKLKQTEVDCEFLKKCCETLTEENRRLKKELQELKALKLTQPLYMPMPAATLTMCPSCERLGGVSDNASNKSPFSMAPKPHFYNPFANPSAACWLWLLGFHSLGWRGKRQEIFPTTIVFFWLRAMRLAREKL